MATDRVVHDGARGLVHVPERHESRLGRDRLHDRRRGRGRARRAGGVGAGHDHAQGAADVGARRRVGRPGGAGDRGAVGPARIAALPLVAVGDRLRPAPAAGARRQRLPVLRRSGDGRRRRVHRRRGGR